MSSNPDIYFKQTALSNYISRIQSGVKEAPFDLAKYSSWNDNSINSNDQSSVLSFLILNVIFEFDIASGYSSKGDGYQFYMHFNSAIHHAMRLYTFLAKENSDVENWIEPKNPIRSMENNFEREFIRGFFPQVTQEDSNIEKRNFLDWFSEILDQFEEAFGQDHLSLSIDEIVEYMNQIYQRDYLYNFRQVQGTRNLFRSPFPGRFILEGNLLKRFLVENNISLIIDLRGNKESSKTLHATSLMKELGIKLLLVDLNEPASTPTHEPRYVQKLIYQKKAILDACREIISTSGATLFHCASGKDRTGILAALFQKLVGVNHDVIIPDYTLSGHDAIPPRIQDVLNYFADVNGVENYLLSTGLTKEEVQLLKEKICQKAL